MTAPESTCACVVDADGFLWQCCDQHKMRMWQNERGMRDALDRELDAVVRELAGRSPTKPPRPAAPSLSFPVTRKP